MDCTIQEAFPETMVVSNVETIDDYLHIELKSIQNAQKCPSCNTETSSKHCSYIRTVDDLPLLGKRVKLTIYLHKYKCTNPDCKTKVFCEDAMGVVDKSQRRSRRLLEYLRDIVFTNSSECGSRICKKNNIPVSGDTLLRIAKSWNPPETKATKIGVDDWAYKKNNLRDVDC